MTAEKLIDCIGMIDEKFISEAVGYVPKRRARHIAAYLSVAACVCVAVTAAVLISGGGADIKTLPDGSLTTISEVREPVQTTYSTPAQTTVWVREPPETVPTGTESSHSVTEKIGTETLPEETHVTSNDLLVVTEQTTSASTSMGGEPETGTETAIVPRWEDLSVIEKYPELYCHGIKYGLSVNDKFTEEEVNFYGNGNVTGMDEYTGEIKTKDCGFYTVSGMDSSYMLAVYTGDGMYTGYMNSSYRTNTLGEYLDGTDFIGRHGFVTVKSSDMSDDTGSYYIRYDLEDVKEFTEDFLLSNSDAPFISECINSWEGIFWSDESFSLIRVYEGGYLYLAGMPADKYFLIGETGFSELTAYLEENAGTEKVYYNTNDGADIPE